MPSATFAIGRDRPLEFCLRAPVERPVLLKAAIRSPTTLIARKACSGNRISNAYSLVSDRFNYEKALVVCEWPLFINIRPSACLMSVSLAGSFRPRLVGLYWMLDYQSDAAAIAHEWKNRAKQHNGQTLSAKCGRFARNLTPFSKIEP
jgi:hypothetical protein